MFKIWAQSEFGIKSNLRYNSRYIYIYSFLKKGNQIFDKNAKLTPGILSQGHSNPKSLIGRIFLFRPPLETCE